MKYKALGYIIAIGLLPHIALASWWNPVSWFNNWSISKKVDPQTQVLENRVRELEQKLNTVTAVAPPPERLASTSSVVVLKPATTTKTVPSTVDRAIIAKQPLIQPRKPIDNTAIIKQEVRKEVEATLKARADQDALIAKQKADAQAKADNQRIELEKQTAQAAAVAKSQKDAQEYAALEAQLNAQKEVDRAQASAINAALAVAQQAAQDKKNKLNAINQQIADLNAKYASDIANAEKASVPMQFINAQKQTISNTYSNAYDSLMAQYQQIQYSN